MDNYEVIENTHPSFENHLNWHVNFSSILQFHQSLDDYQITPLHSLSNLAKKINVKEIAVKDESYRFGLNSFKGLGVSYALSQLKGDFNTVVSCTDGNHGKALAWYAQKLNKKAIIFMPKGAEDIRIQAIEDLGAKVIVTSLNYDDTVRLAQKKAMGMNAVFVQDTSFDNYLDIPANIMLGYSTLIQEAFSQLEKEPTHIFLQAGVGSFAAGAILATIALCKKKPYIGIVESNQCSCIYESFSQKRIVNIGGNPQTIMAGLNCGEPSILALPIIEKNVEWLIKCCDYLAYKGMDRGNHPLNNDPKFSAGESGAVTLGLLEEIENTKMKDYFHLDSNSIILLINTEGRVNIQ